MEYISIEENPDNFRLLNNYMMVEFLDDDIKKLSTVIKFIKQNNSTKLRSIYVGKVIKHPDHAFSAIGDKKLEFSLENLKDNETILAYNPMSIKVEITWEDKKYHIIRVEDIYCELVGWTKDKEVV